LIFTLLCKTKQALDALQNIWDEQAFTQVILENSKFKKTNCNLKACSTLLEFEISNKIGLAFTL